MRIPCSPIFAACGLGFGLAIPPSAIAAADESYTNLIAPHQRVQPVRGPVCLYIFSSCDTLEAFPHPFARPARVTYVLRNSC